MTEFVKTETVIKKTVNTVINGSLPNAASLSVVPDGNNIQLVIGAEYIDGVCCLFGKEGFADLIKVLQDIHEVM